MLGDVLVNEADVPEQFYISDEKLPDWRYLKGSKREERTNKITGFTYTYSEGAMSFPDASTSRAAPSSRAKAARAPADLSMLSSAPTAVSAASFPTSSISSKDSPRAGRILV